MKIKKIEKELLRHIKKNFDINDDGIATKYYHIQRVAKHARNIATFLNLSKDDTNLAYVVGLFHDYGRFEQWRLHQTYSDLKSYPHNKLGVELLFEKGEIKYYSIPERHHKLLETTIIQHSLIAIEDHVTEAKELLFSKLIRDADKCDLFEMHIDGKIKLRYEKEGYNEVVGNTLKEKKTVSFKDVKSNLDFLLLSLGTIYDLHFDYSYKFLLDINYFEKMLAHYKQFLNEEDFNIFEKFLKIVEEDVNKKMEHI